MSDFICPYTCSYRTNSGYCGRTGGAESCQYRMIVNAHGADATVFAGSNMRKPLTNYDRLISKTPEEMAKWLGDKDTCPPECWKYLYDDVDCAECWLAWMKQEASE